MSALEVWFKTNLSWLGFVLMVAFGSIVAHIKAYEISEVEWSVWQHFWGIVKRLLYGIFAGMLVYSAYKYFKWDEWLGFIGTGICSVFAPDLFDLLWKLGKAKVAQHSGVKLEDLEKNQP